MSLANKTKHWLRDLFRYPVFQYADRSYGSYWGHRDVSAKLNSFQKERVRYIIDLIASGDSVLDVGCGDGKILAELKRQCSALGVVRGLDSADPALEAARARGIETIKGSVGDADTLPDIGEHDWILLLEVIEHVPHSEELLAWAMAHARKGVIFSVPNTGFVFHRLRLLFGRFPLQWRAHPSEHIRFWTLRDMRWWLRHLGYTYELHAYEGLPLMSQLWPSMFAAGMIITLPHG